MSHPELMTPSLFAGIYFVLPFFSYPLQLHRALQGALLREAALCAGAVRSSPDTVDGTEQEVTAPSIKMHPLLRT